MLQKWKTTSIQGWVKASRNKIELSITTSLTALGKKKIANAKGNLVLVCPEDIGIVVHEPTLIALDARKYKEIMLDKSTLKIAPYPGY